MIVLIRKEEASAEPAPPPMHDQSIQCRLLALPAELRNHIWSYLLIQDTDNKITTYPITKKPPTSTIDNPLPHLATLVDLRTHRGSAPRICPKVLQTCRQIHAEGTAMLYGLNVFDAHGSLLTALPSLSLQTLPSRVTAPPVTSPRVARLIRRFFLHVRLDTDPRYSRSQVAHAFTGVSELEIEVFQSSYGTCDFSVLALFEDIRDIGLVTIHGSIGDGKYAAHLQKIMQSPAGTVWPKYHERFVGGDQAWDAWTHGNR